MLQDYWLLLHSWAAAVVMWFSFLMFCDSFLASLVIPHSFTHPQQQVKRKWERKEGKGKKGREGRKERERKGRRFLILIGEIGRKWKSPLLPLLSPPSSSMVILFLCLGKVISLRWWPSKGTVCLVFFNNFWGISRLSCFLALDMLGLLCKSCQIIE